jgi:crotonobetainyl-CoA:carnitine CoA-transferase CaiB-like acyl-CoA transferase
MVVNVPKPDGATQPQLGCPITFSGSRAEYRHVGVPVGAHTEAVLGEMGYTEDEIQRLRGEGVFGRV